jgi:hypothetical protein
LWRVYDPVFLKSFRANLLSALRLRVRPSQKIFAHKSGQRVLATELKKDDTYFAVCIRRVDKADACSVVTAKSFFFAK